MDKTMSGLIKFILWFVVICIVICICVWGFSISLGFGFLTGMSKKYKETTQITTEQTNNKSSIATSSNTNVTNNNTTNNSNVNSDNKNSYISNDENVLQKSKLTLKEGYYNQFDEIDMQCENINNNGAKSTQQLAENAEEIYELWDDQLNVIYNNLKNTLSNEEFKILEKQQIKWIKYKEDLAEQTYDSYSGNGEEKAELEEYKVLATLTKEKCEELVNGYV